MRSRVVTLLLAGNRVSADALKADFLAMYTEVKIQVPSLSLLPAPRWNGRQGYQDGISPLLHCSAYLPSKHCFHLKLSKLAKMPTTWPGHLQPHCFTCCSIFHEHDAPVVSPSLRSQKSMDRVASCSQKEVQDLFAIWMIYTICRWHYRFAEVFQNLNLHKPLVT